MVARKYDDGTVSATRRDDYLAKIRSRIEGALSNEQQPPSLESLMAGFMDKVSKHRQQTELHRIAVSEKIPDEDGKPIGGGFKGYVTAILAAIRYDAWDYWLVSQLAFRLVAPRSPTRFCGPGSEFASSLTGRIEARPHRDGG